MCNCKRNKGECLIARLPSGEEDDRFGKYGETARGVRPMPSNLLAIGEREGIEKIAPRSDT